MSADHEVLLIGNEKELANDRKQFKNAGIPNFIKVNEEQQGSKLRFEERRAWSKFKGDVNVPNYGNCLNGALDEEAGLLPPGLRLVTSGFVVLEKRPAIRTIRYRTKSAGRGSVEIGEVALPWQIIYITHTDLVVSAVGYNWRHSQATSLQSPVYRPMLGNVYTSGQVCLPKGLLSKRHQSLGDMIGSVEEAMFSGITNADIMVDTSEMNRMKLSIPPQFHHFNAAYDFTQTYPLESRTVVWSKDMSLSHILNQWYLPMLINNNKNLKRPRKGGVDSEGVYAPAGYNTIESYINYMREFDTSQNTDDYQRLAISLRHSSTLELVV